MVIQRSWKLQSESLPHQGTSSDDSNGSNHTISSSNTSSSKMHAPKYVTTPQMAESVLSRLKQRFATQATGQKSSEAVMRSLELLRINIQVAFDKEIDAVVKNFIENYFKPAFKNIKENLGENVVSDDVLQKMSCALLENSKSQYNTRVKINIVSSSIQSEVTSAAARPAELATQINTNSKRSSDAPPTELGPVSKKPMLQSSTRYQPPRRQIFWNTANITTETRFLLDVQANQAFGFGTDGRERLASKHPELIRYLPDGQDRDWLVQQKIIPAQNRNSRFLFLIYDEILKLGQSEYYKSRESMNLEILHAFKIPHFIIQKMKMFFVDLNIKSRGLITNSFSTAIGSSHLRNALLQGSQSSTVAVSSSTDNSQSVASVKPKSSLSSSHATLTALLTNNSDNIQQASESNSVSG